ncbi:hypothetical protein C1Y63_01025 [Corynebacterium sp. 13CS0277]|uniref:hypothetical protein n=1 Tax=Corynebacterium sp. 13CS0277 TaxID=2071994 RepID=UPI000D02F5E4|nr:hypothetical protein [Corynebacterium sp. 13CS0277]PRQ12406.1 hypothetical protein C1Y63_01025 [Corynebacterium sp. 13CS0277]
MLKKALATTAATLVAATAFATPAHASELDLLGLLLGTNTAENLSCQDVKSGLETLGLYSPEDTRITLETKIKAKATDLAGNNAVIAAAAAKVGNDVSGKAEECGLIKKDPIALLSSQLGSSEAMPQLGNLRGMIEPLLALAPKK